jgi:hypothetical protein
VPEGDVVKRLLKEVTNRSIILVDKIVKLGDDESEVTGTLGLVRISLEHVRGGSIGAGKNVGAGIVGGHLSFKVSKRSS